jgi:hypothetical protein
MREIRNAYILFENLKRKRPVGDLDMNEKYFRIDHRVIGYMGGAWIIRLRMGSSSGLL